MQQTAEEEEESDSEAEYVLSMPPTSRLLLPATTSPAAQPAACCGNASSPIIISEGGLEEGTTPEQKSIQNISSNAMTHPSLPQLSDYVTPLMASQLKSVSVEKLDLRNDAAKRVRKFAVADGVKGGVTTPPRRASRNDTDDDTTPTLDARHSDGRHSSECHTNLPGHEKEPIDGYHVNLTPIRRSKKRVDRVDRFVSSGIGERTPPIGGVVGGGITMPDTPPLPAVSHACLDAERENLVTKDLKRNLFQSCDTTQRSDLPSTLASNKPSTKWNDKRVPSVISESPDCFCPSPSPVGTHRATSLNSNSVRSHKVGSLSLKKKGVIPTFTSVIQQSNLKESTENVSRLSPKGPQDMEMSTCGNSISSLNRTPDVETVAPDDTRKAVTKTLSPLSYKNVSRVTSQNVSDDCSNRKRRKMLDRPKSKLSPSPKGPTKGGCPARTTKQSRVHSPPLFYARGDISPADYSKIILRSLDSYLSRLAVAQSKVIHRVRWGKPIMSSSKKMLKYLVPVNRVTLAQDSHPKYVLPIGQYRGPVSPERSRMQEDHAMHNSNENCILDRCLGIGPTQDATATNKDSDEDGKGDFIPLNSYEEEESEESQLCDALHVHSEERNVQTTLCETHEEEEDSTERGRLRNSEMQKKVHSPILGEKNPPSDTEVLLERTHDVIQISTQDAVSGGSPRSVSTTAADATELAGDSVSTDGSPILPRSRRQLTCKFSDKEVLRKRRLDVSEESDAMSHQIINDRQTSDSELRNSQENSRWLNSRKRPKISVSSSKRPRISKVSTRRKEKTKTMVAKKKEALTPLSRKKGSAAARLFCRRKGMDERDPSSESGVDSSAMGEQDSRARQRKERTPLKGPSRSFINSSDSDERNSVVYPSEPSGVREVAAGRAKNKW